MLFVRFCRRLNSMNIEKKYIRMKILKRFRLKYSFIQIFWRFITHEISFLPSTVLPWHSVIFILMKYLCMMWNKWVGNLYTQEKNLLKQFFFTVLRICQYLMKFWRFSAFQWMKCRKLFILINMALCVRKCYGTICLISVVIFTD